jgi:hypothetical protein
MLFSISEPDRLFLRTIQPLTNFLLSALSLHLRKSIVNRPCGDAVQIKMVKLPSQHRLSTFPALAMSDTSRDSMSGSRLGGQKSDAFDVPASDARSAGKTPRVSDNDPIHYSRSEDREAMVGGGKQRDGRRSDQGFNRGDLFQASTQYKPISHNPSTFGVLYGAILSSMCPGRAMPVKIRAQWHFRTVLDDSRSPDIKRVGFRDDYICE